MIWLTKRKWMALGQVFEAEFSGRLPFQSRALTFKELERDELVAPCRIESRDRLGTLIISGWILTERGRYAYCSSCTRFDPAVPARPASADSERRQ